MAVSRPHFEAAWLPRRACFKCSRCSLHRHLSGISSEEDMEGVLVGSSPRTKTPAPAPLSRMSSTGRLPGSLAVADLRRRTVPPLRCMRSQESNRYATITSNDDFANSVEVREWESGKSINEIAAKQGIRIRRSFGNPSESLKGEETPRNILEKIIWDKEVEVAEFKQTKSLDALKKAVEGAAPTRDFVGALRESYLRTGLPALIAEVKKASPSRGVLRENFDPVEVANAYEKSGAACLSILTDKKYFQGGFENLEAVRKAGIECPLLCKEFIIDSWQIYYARLKGADAVLLIAGVLVDLDIKYMINVCRELGLATLVEVHDEREMDRMLQIDGIQLIGINNRNLETFDVDIANTKKLLDGERGDIIRQKGIIVVGESGLFTPADVSYVQDAGVRAVLVGESLVKQPDPGRAISGLFGKDISK